MRDHGECPKCEGKTFYRVERARMGDGESANGTIPLALAAHYVATGEQGLFGEKQAKVEAHVDAWICATCGFSELYVRDLAKLEHLRKQGAEGVSFVDAASRRGGASR